jgi:hypothetical protein
MWLFKSGGNLLDRGKRPSPKESATLFPSGYRLKGQDGNIWQIVIASNGVRRWQKVADDIKKSVSKTIVKPKQKTAVKAKTTKSKPPVAKKAKSTKKKSTTRKKAKGKC